MVAGLVTPDLPDPHPPGGWSNGPWLPWLVGGMAVGCALPAVVHPAYLLLWLLLAWAAGITLLVLGSRGGLRRPLAQALAAVLCVLAGMAAVGSSDQLPHPRLVDAPAQVTRVLYTGYGTGFLASVPSVQGQRPLMVRAGEMLTLRSGDRIQLRGRLSHEQGRHGDLRPVLRATAVHVIEVREEGARGFAWRALERIGPHRDLAAALLLGEGRPQARDQFHQAGLLHLLAVSGLHLGLALVLLAWAMRIGGLPWWPRQILLLLGAGSYAWLVGMSLPTQRAAIMTMAVVLYGMSGREQHRLGPLSLAVLMLLVIDPSQAREVGFQLSALAVFGILTLGLDLVALRRRLLPLHPWPLDTLLWRMLLRTLSGACDGLAVGLAASLAVMPITAGNFGEITPMSPLISVLAGPFLLVVLAAGLPLLFFQGLFPGGPWNGLHVLVDGGLAGLVAVAEWSPQLLPGALVRVAAPGPLLWLGWFFLCLPLKTGRDVLLRLLLLLGLILLW